MDVIVIFNGLGNQMSQYSFYLKKKAINPNTDYIIFCKDHNGFELEKVFKIGFIYNLKRSIFYLIFRILLTEKIKLIFSPLKEILIFFGCRIIKENFKYNFNSEFLNSPKGLNFYFGGWHSELYFSSEYDQIIKKFNFDKPQLNAKNISFLNLIQITNSISFHIRRGDFLNSSNINLFGSICTLEYFKKAKIEIEKKISRPHYFIFSNDMDWVKSNLTFENVTYVEGNEGQNSYLDMYLMSNCKNHIIANSSFSWWGAWLNSDNNKIVICPSKFSNNDINSDVYPNNWLKIKSN
jgi:hypothetical protein